MFNFLKRESVYLSWIANRRPSKKLSIKISHKEIIALRLISFCERNIIQCKRIIHLSAVKNYLSSLVSKKPILYLLLLNLSVSDCQFLLKNTLLVIIIFFLSISIITTRCNKLNCTYSDFIYSITIRLLLILVLVLNEDALAVLSVIKKLPCFRSEMKTLRPSQKSHLNIEGILSKKKYTWDYHDEKIKSIEINKYTKKKN